MPSARVIPEDVLDLKAPTKKFLCPLTANEYGIEFLSFVIQDYRSKKTIFEVSRDRPLPIDFSTHDALDPDSLRKINYELSEDFLMLPQIYHISFLCRARTSQGLPHDRAPLLP